MKKKDTQLLEEAYSSMYMFALIEDVDYEGSTLLGVYTSPEAAKKAMKSMDEPSTADVNFRIEKVLVNSTPTRY